MIFNFCVNILYIIVNKKLNTKTQNIMKTQFEKLCKTALQNLPAFAVREEMRTTLFSTGARIYLLTGAEIRDTYRKVFGFSFDD
jgi:adenylylsulfate kinase-like enzyme